MSEIKFNYLMYSNQIKEICGLDKELSIASEEYLSVSRLLFDYSKQMESKENLSGSDIVLWDQYFQDAQTNKAICDKKIADLSKKTLDFIMSGGEVDDLAKALYPNDDKAQAEYMLKIINGLIPPT